MRLIITDATREAFCELYAAEGTDLPSGCDRVADRLIARGYPPIVAVRVALQSGIKNKEVWRS